MSSYILGVYQEFLAIPLSIETRSTGWWRQIGYKCWSLSRATLANLGGVYILHFLASTTEQIMSSSSYAGQDAVPDRVGLLVFSFSLVLPANRRPRPLLYSILTYGCIPAVKPPGQFCRPRDSVRSVYEYVNVSVVYGTKQIWKMLANLK